MTVKVYGSKLNTAPHETYEAGGCSVLEWLQATASDFEVREDPPISVLLNGAMVPHGEWGATFFEHADDVRITLEPKGTELFFGALFVLATRAMSVKIPKIGSGTQSGSDINQASIKGNKVKINSIIREAAGRNPIYPDYVLPPRRWFAGPREQRVQMCLSVGKGYFDTPANRLLIGDTPAISLGSDVKFQFYDPGADLSADPCAEWWHDVTEVGSSSSGAAGLELTVSTSLTPGVNLPSLQFNGFTIASPNGSFPSDWSAGLLIQVVAPYQYEFVEGGADRDTIRGVALRMLNPEVGDRVQIIGTNAGTYVVETYEAGDETTPPEMTLSFENGNPVTALSIGIFSTAIGPVGLRYRVTVFSLGQLTVSRLTSTGAPDTDWPGFDFTETANGGVALDPSNFEGGYRGPFAVCPEGAKVTAIEWDVFCPKGIMGLGREGQEFEVMAFHTFEYRDMDTAGAWTVIEKTHSGASWDALGFTNRVDLPYPMRPEARIKKRFVQQVQRENEVNNDTNWYGLRGLMQFSPSRYEGLTILTLDARGGDRLSAQAESEVSIEATRKLPVRRGGQWLPMQATRDIVPWVLHTLKDVGYTDADLDLAEFDRLDAVLRARGDKFDQALVSSNTAQAVVANALAAGYSEVTAEWGQLRPVRDEPRTAFESTYSPQDYVEGSPLDRQVTLVSPNDYDGVDCEYVDGVSGQTKTVECRLPGDQGRRALKVVATGITDRTYAWRFGMRERRRQKYVRWTYRAETYLAGLNSRLKSYVQLADDVPGYAQSAVMEGYSNRVVEVSERFEWEGPGPHYLYVRREDGTSSGPYVATRVDDFHLRIAEPLDFEPVLDLSILLPRVLFGPGYPVLVTEIAPGDDDSVTIEAETYDVRVYADDDNFPPE